MNKHIIQAFIILIIILLGVSLISESNEKVYINNTIKEFEEDVAQNTELENGNIVEIEVMNEDSSNLISDVNAKIATLIVGGLNKILSFVIKLMDGITN